MHQCVDKYSVREFVKSKGLEHTLVELYGKYSSVEEIDVSQLPDKFVMKTTNGGGGNNVVLCSDKSKFDINSVREQLHSTKIKSRTAGREWAYYGLEPGIIVEELLINKHNPEAGVNDYKIFCYNGVPEYIIVDTDRYIGHKRNFYDTKWNNLNITSDCPSTDSTIPKPEALDDMLKIAAKLSEDFPFVRVDLYNQDEKIYFGELTFYPWSGYVQFEPDSVDYILGEKFILPKTSK